MEKDTFSAAATTITSTYHCTLKFDQIFFSISSEQLDY